MSGNVEEKHLKNMPRALRFPSQKAVYISERFWEKHDDQGRIVI